MSEISKYEAQKKKLDGLCEEHDLTYRFRHDVYPITLTVRPLQGVGEQLSLLADDNKDYISHDAYLMIYRKDGELAMKTHGTFTVSEALSSKLKNIYTKMSDFWREYFFRDLLERGAIKSMPVIDEDEAQDDDEQATEDPEEEDPEDIDEEDADEAFSSEDLIQAATLLVRSENKASISLLQRRLKLGYSRASLLMTDLEARGIVGPIGENGTREVLPFDQPED